jgi:hypothetical protein
LINSSVVGAGGGEGDGAWEPLLGGGGAIGLGWAAGDWEGEAGGGLADGDCARIVVNVGQKMIRNKSRFITRR